MAKRTIWFAIGAAAGASAGIYSKIKVDKKIQGSTPLRVSKDIVVSSTKLLNDAKRAIEEGFREMKRELDRSQPLN
ncbi:MAG: hypothetical protein M0019_05215 [Actinomycetota bacterium]|nr:hypothetical protein [Actinomycetota bacterium]